MIRNTPFTLVAIMMLGVCGCAENNGAGSLEKVQIGEPTLRSGDYELRLIYADIDSGNEDTRVPASVRIEGTKLVIDTRQKDGNKPKIAGVIQGGEIEASCTSEEEGHHVNVRFNGKVTSSVSANGTVSFSLDGGPVRNGKWLLSFVERREGEDRQGDTESPEASAAPLPQTAVTPPVAGGSQSIQPERLRRVPSSFETIQQAINAASKGDTILVADGTYRGSGNTNLDFKGQAITVKSENGPDKCIIDCGGKARGFYFHSGETISSVVSGFTIRNGTGAKLERKWAGRTPTVGGGISCVGAAPRIEDNVLLNNSADLGGAIAAFDSDGIVIRGNRIAGNKASDSNGGGVFLSACRNAVIQHNLIEANLASKGGGGGICLQQCVDGRLERNRILDNKARGGGGASIGNSRLIITNNIIARNESSGTTNGPYCFDGGGALSLWDARVEVVNNTIVANRAWIRGGAVYVAYTKGARFVNNVFWENYSPQGKDVYLAFYESSTKFASSIAIEHCVWQGGDNGFVVEKGCELSAEANLEENPILADPDRGDYRLTDASPCIDRGKADVGPPEDIEGTARPHGGGVDIGAFEHPARPGASRK